MPTHKTLSTGASIPMIANGTWDWDAASRERGKEWIAGSFKMGYRHIDTALIYGMEKAVGDAIKLSGVDRKDIWITTKLPWNHHSRVSESIDESLTNLDVESVDLYLMHWPHFVRYDPDNFLPKNPDGSYAVVDSPTFVEVWAEMEKVFKTGKARAIGVCNFSVKNLEILLETARVVPAVNQVEMHPYLAQNELREYCKDKGIAIEAYTPSGLHYVRSDPVVIDIAKKHGATPNQVALAWNLARDVIIVPKSASENRQRENLFLPMLDDGDLRRIDGLDRNQRVCPGNFPDENGMVMGWSMEKLGW
ncbi:reductase AKOR2 [Dendrothele bispora CBS 962.96]|uniref:Reductase AKOR2 n=1 Tax=Dendrothele bispora (strain CBS 962.96) TaxID=1314807 RepID=A0A4S8LUW0_DENBC|nr:reductase AKOR2 [Dendrothele bispora CBS 962.96]